MTPACYERTLHITASKFCLYCLSPCRAAGLLFLYMGQRGLTHPFAPFPGPALDGQPLVIANSTIANRLVESLLVDFIEAVVAVGFIKLQTRVQDGHTEDLYLRHNAVDEALT